MLFKVLHTLTCKYMYYCNIGSTLVLASCYLCIHALYMQNYYKQKQTNKKNTLIVSIPLQPVGLGLFTAPSPIVPSLHRLKPSLF